MAPAPRDSGGAQPAEGGAAQRAPSLSLPRGGGAIRGMGETFKTNAVSGTASMTVPLALSPGRGQLGPELALTYDSGNGNGPFGFGWSLGLPRIERRTDKGLPRYLDDEESDEFMLTGADALVPAGDGGEIDGHDVRRYRPRIEALFARIERWTRLSDGAVHWRSISRDNVTTLYGTDTESRVYEGGDAPERPARVFAWLACESYDDKGNAILYEYAAEDPRGVDATLAHERNRPERSRRAERYPKRIKYGNVVSRLDETPGLDWRDAWLFELVFDYGEGHYRDVPPDPGLSVDELPSLVLAAVEADGTWAVRPDPFSTHRPGFELRTYRRCLRALLFHRFAELGAEPCLVRSTEFDYADADYTTPLTVDAEVAHQGSTRFGSFIRSISHRGFIRDAAAAPVVTDDATYQTYVARSTPPLEFEYSRATIDDELRELDAADVEHLPVGLADDSYRWVDLDGEGIAGVLSEHEGAWYYKPALGDGHFGPSELVAPRPALGDLGGPRQLLDLDGDGRLDLVLLADDVSGFHARTGEHEWAPFRQFESRPTIGWQDPNSRLVDLNGDGLADVLVTEDEAFACYPSLGQAGYGPAERARAAWDEDQGPHLVLADGTDSIYLADMCGDGLSDLVRIRNGEVAYWPNLGRGRFGAKVTMDGAPWFDHPDRFDQRLIQLADIDGSGVSDIVYLGTDGVRVFLNRSGNQWAPGRVLTQFAPVDEHTIVSVTDLLGTGTTCVVWSSPLPGDARSPIRYIDLMSGGKPHLLTRAVNNLGAETRIHYLPSTRFYLADKRAGRAWATRIPFPVQVVRSVETYDRISGNRFVTRYAYHHGHFDGSEREFRGFGMVEQWDTEEIGALRDGASPPDTNTNASSDLAPVLTCTWFHTGVFAGRGNVSRALAAGYYAHAEAMLLPDTELPAGLDGDEEREACRALKGAMLRREVYALDGSADAGHPYTVTEQSFAVRCLQARADNRHAVFLTHASESITYHYERAPADPRVQHKLTLAADDFGNELITATVAYPRRTPDLTLDLRERARQAELRITYVESDFTNPVEEAHDHRAPLAAESRTYELTGLAMPNGRLRFERADFDDVADADPIGYEQAPTAGVFQKRPIEHVRTIYRRDDLAGPLGLKTLEPRALPFNSYKLAFTPALLSALYDGRATDAMLTQGGYRHQGGDANWWVPTGEVFYSPDTDDTGPEELAYALRHFFQPTRYRDPFHTNAASTETTISYDAYDLLVEETRDPAGNRITAGERAVDVSQPLVRHGLDYRVLKPVLLMDPNRNCSSVEFDALGMVAATATAGKPEDAPARGDRLAGAPEPTAAAIAAAMADPVAGAHALLAAATTRLVYDILGYYRTREQPHPQPSGVLTLARETHDAELTAGELTRIQHTLSYSDGFGREIQRKTRAEAGPVPVRDTATGAIVIIDGRPQMTAADVDPRWIGSGWTVYNNKGKPVRQYEPFFTDIHRFEFDVRIGVSSVRHYDPLERMIATLYPNHAWDKVVWDTWRSETWDVNDTVAIADPAADPDVGDFFARLEDAEYTPTWLAQRSAGALGALEQTTADKATVHRETPSVQHLDSRGLAVATVAHNAFVASGAPPGTPRTEEHYTTRARLDIEGNLREVIDAADRVAARFDYDMLGNRVRESSMEAGERHKLDNVAGKPHLRWDGMGRRFQTTQDALRRPVELRLLEGVGPERVIERHVWGETAASPEAANQRSKLIERRDQAGIATMAAYDFKGNLTRSTQRLAANYKTTLNWLTVIAMDATTYEHRTSYDALNRPTEITTPDASTIEPTYNQAGLLERIDGSVRGAAPVAFITGVEYDARGQRTLVELANGARTRYEYDPDTFRLVRTVTRRDPATFPDDCPEPPPAGWPGCRVQSLRYVFDPVGNVAHISDEAQQAVFFRNVRIAPGSDYTFDALYRLIEATGREHVAPTPSGYDDRPRTKLVHPHDGRAVARYSEIYQYDEIGNFLELLHHSSDSATPDWTRSYAYGEASQLEPAKSSNRLTSTTADGVTAVYSTAGDGYDAHGNMLRMPQLAALEWDFNGRLRMTRRQRVDVDDVDGELHKAEQTYYVYDADGKRTRRVTERPDGQIKDERRYLDGLEIYTRSGPNALTRESLHVRDGKRPIALVETRTDGPPGQVVRFQFDDLIGSVRLELDEQARILTYEEYTPFGSTALQSADPQLEAPKRYRYTGKERDDDSGLYYHGARYLAPWLGRWTAPDPVGLQGSVNLYVYVSNNPTVLVDPDGRQEHSASGADPGALRAVAAAASGSGTSAAGGLAAVTGASAAAGSGGGSGGGGSGGGGSGGGGLGGVLRAIGGFFDRVAGGLADVATWMREWLPGLIAAPLAGLVDILGGLSRVIGGLFSWKGSTVVRGLKEMGLGALSIFGLKEVIGERWESGGAAGLPTGLNLPKTLAADLTLARSKTPANAHLNGMHAWHAATNAVVTQRVGPVAAPFLWIAGLVHESPIDWGSFQAEQHYQGTVNHILDSFMDIISNTFGILVGLLLPRKAAVEVAAFLGNYIPGPGDPDPAFGGAGAYTGHPTRAWGQYP